MGSFGYLVENILFWATSLCLVYEDFLGSWSGRIDHIVVDLGRQHSPKKPRKNLHSPSPGSSRTLVPLLKNFCDMGHFTWRRIFSREIYGRKFFRLKNDMPIWSNLWWWSTSLSFIWRLNTFGEDCDWDNRRNDKDILFLAWHFLEFPFGLHDFPRIPSNKSNLRSTQKHWRIPPQMARLNPRNCREWKNDLNLNGRSYTLYLRCCSNCRGPVCHDCCIFVDHFLVLTKLPGFPRNPWNRKCNIGIWTIDLNFTPEV